MRATFVHTADNHLGYEQYGSRERFDDFAKAFEAVVKDAIARHADFFVVSGDLFNKRAIDALTLIQAHGALKLLAEAGIPAIGIEGNHDRSYYRDGVFHHRRKGPPEVVEALARAILLIAEVIIRRVNEGRSHRSPVSL
ncbi:MAG TPA: metallophosphoesterase, partial [Ktedonobacterales bacterium]|nr:metallophosphoesterase [Ktedonobacterales bacterium]